jgi:transcriptional regulator with XRE-family HTH domain
MEFGKRLSEIREQAGLTQSGLARRMGTSQSTISQIEAGERNPTYDLMRQIAEALGVSIAYLAGGGVENEQLSPAEEAHFRNYRSLSPDARQELANFAAFLRSKKD